MTVCLAVSQVDSDHVTELLKPEGKHHSLHVFLNESILGLFAGYLCYVEVFWFFLRFTCINL